MVAEDNQQGQRGARSGRAPVPQPLTRDERAAVEQAEVNAELAENPRDKIVEGGRFAVADPDAPNGFRFVNAMGEPFEEKDGEE